MRQRTGTKYDDAVALLVGIRTGEQAAEELANGGGEFGVAAVRGEVHLAPDRDAVHVDLHEQAATLVRAVAGLGADAVLSLVVTVVTRRRLRRRL